MSLARLACLGFPWFSLDFAGIPLDLLCGPRQLFFACCYVIHVLGYPYISLVPLGSPRLADGFLDASTRNRWWSRRRQQCPCLFGSRCCRAEHPHGLWSDVSILSLHRFYGLPLFRVCCLINPGEGLKHPRVSTHAQSHCSNQTSEGKGRKSCKCLGQKAWGAVAGSMSFRSCMRACCLESSLSRRKKMVHAFLTAFWCGWHGYHGLRLSWSLFLESPWAFGVPWVVLDHFGPPASPKIFWVCWDLNNPGHLHRKGFTNIPVQPASSRRRRRSASHWQPTGTCQTKDTEVVCSSAFLFKAGQTWWE